MLYSNVVVHTKTFRWHDVGLWAALEFCTFLSLAITWSQNIERSLNWWSKVSSKFSLVRLRQLLIHVPCLFMALFSSARMQQVLWMWPNADKNNENKRRSTSRDHSNLSSVIQFLSYKRKYYAKTKSIPGFLPWKMDRVYYSFYQWQRK